MNINQDIVSKQFRADDFDSLLDDLIKEIELHNYQITRINHIDNIYDRLEAGIEVTIGFKRYKIVEFCNLNSCSELISADLTAGVFMPVKFVVYQRIDEKSINIAFLRPTAFAKLYDSVQLMDVATNIEQDMIHVVEELDY